MKALVVYHNHGSHGLDRLFKAGFKHVYVALLSEGYWIVVDGKAGVPEVSVVAGKDFDLVQFYEANGFRVQQIDTTNQPIRSPFVLANCVGLVKAMVGAGGFAMTPYQLYKNLRRLENG